MFTANAVPIRLRDQWNSLCTGSVNRSGMPVEAPAMTMVKPAMAAIHQARCIWRNAGPLLSCGFSVWVTSPWSVHGALSTSGPMANMCNNQAMASFRHPDRHHVAVLIRQGMLPMELGIVHQLFGSAKVHDEPRYE